MDGKLYQRRIIGLYVSDWTLLENTEISRRKLTLKTKIRKEFDEPNFNLLTESLCMQTSLNHLYTMIWDYIILDQLLIKIIMIESRDILNAQNVS